MNTIIEVRNLTKKYGNKDADFTALNNVELDIYKGEFVAVMGPSGSGKTTLLNLMSTIDSASRGTIKINNNLMENFKEKELAVFRRETIGFVFQEFNLLDNMRVQDNIALPLTLSNVNSDLILEKVNELTLLFGIKDHLEKYPYQLSGGQKQRAAVCRALINNPKIIFADEPTGALDSKSASELLECFRSTKKLYGTTVVMVTHDALAASYCDRVLFLKDGVISGKLETDGNSSEFFKKILNMVAMLGGNSNEHI